MGDLGTMSDDSFLNLLKAILALLGAVALILSIWKSIIDLKNGDRTAEDLDRLLRSEIGRLDDRLRAEEVATLEAKRSRARIYGSPVEHAVGADVVGGSDGPVGAGAVRGAAREKPGGKGCGLMVEDLLRTPLSAGWLLVVQCVALACQAAVVWVKMYSLFVLRSPGGNVFFLVAMGLMLGRRVTALHNLDLTTAAQLDAAVLPAAISVCLLVAVLMLMRSEVRAAKKWELAIEELREGRGQCG